MKREPPGGGVAVDVGVGVGFGIFDDDPQPVSSTATASRPRSRPRTLAHSGVCETGRGDPQDTPGAETTSAAHSPARCAQRLRCTAISPAADHAADAQAEACPVHRLHDSTIAVTAPEAD